MPRSIRLWAIVWVSSAGAVAMAQNMDQVRARTDAGFDAARMAARTSFDALANYPKDARDAVLTLSTRPELIVKLNEARLAGTSQIDAIASPYGADVLVAARTVTAQPLLLQALADRLPVVALMGQSIGDQMPAIRVLLDREAEVRATSTRAVVDAWRKRATVKPVVTNQLRDASTQYVASENTLQPIGSDVIVLADHRDTSLDGEREAKLDLIAGFTQHSVKPLPSDPGNVSSGFGYATNASMPVTGLPGHDEVYYTLVHADQYPELAAAIIEQWYFEHNPDGFRTAVDAWYTTYQETLPSSLGGQGAYLPAILKERMLFEKRYLAAMRDPATTRMRRSEFLDANLKEFPALTRVRDGEIIASFNDTPSVVPGGPVSKSTSSGSSGGRSSSGQSSTSSMGRTNRSTSNRGGGRNNALGDVTGGVNTSRDTRGNRGNSRFGNSSSGRGGFGSSNNSGGGFGGSTGFGSSGGSSGGFGGSSGGFGGGSGFGSSSGGSRGSSRFGSSSNGSRNN